jgi:hypothetical protein
MIAAICARTIIKDFGFPLLPPRHPGPARPEGDQVMIAAIEVAWLRPQLEGQGKDILLSAGGAPAGRRGRAMRSMFFWWFLAVLGGGIGNSAVVVGPFDQPAACQAMREWLQVNKPGAPGTNVVRTSDCWSSGQGSK